MRTRFAYVFQFLVGAVALAGWCDENDRARWVDVFTGTGGTGHTTPAACVPFGAIQVGPDTGTGSWDYCSGYRYQDDSTLGYSLNHLSGTGCPDLGDIRILPFTGEVRPLPMRSRIDKRTEKAGPGWYVVHQSDDAVDVELTATKRVALMRLTWRKDGPRRVLVDLASVIDEPWCKSRTFNAEIRKDGDSELFGSFRKDVWIKNRDIGFSLRFDRPWKSCGVVSEAKGTEAPCYVVEFDLRNGESLGLSVAWSAVDAEGARKNLTAEAPADLAFDVARNRAEAAWNEILTRFSCEGDGTQKTNFYTSVYHLFFQPNDWADCDGRCRGADGRIRPAPGGSYLTQLSVWDTFRAACPLYTIVAPEIVDATVNSIVAQAEDRGWMPMLGFGGRCIDGMIGNHGASIVADAYLKGFRGFDVERAYAVVRNTLLQSHAEKEKEDWTPYDRHGYFPCDIVRRESVSRTLECCFDDWCAGIFARNLAKHEDAVRFLDRAQNWTNVFDSAIGLARGKRADGCWREPFDPYALGHVSQSSCDFTEGNSFQYTWHVMQDPDGLAVAMGGRQKFVERLDSLFTRPIETLGMGKVLDVTGLIGQYAHGNEPSHHVIYYYPQVGHPEKAAERVREVFDKFYNPGPNGLCGNDDCGQMSAWYLFSAMGFYPFNPCGGEYVIGAPQLPEVTLKLAGGKSFRMIAHGFSAANKYVKAVRLNGRPHYDCKIRHAEVVSGGVLEFEMSDRPCNWMVRKAPHGLTAEYRKDPVGIDADKPRLSWKLPDGVRRQSAYEIVADGWRTGKVVSDQSLNVVWEGAKLMTGGRVGWKVRVWDEEGRVSDWSERAQFVMGVMDIADWKAKWIGPNAMTRPDEDMTGARWITGLRGTNGLMRLVGHFDFSGDVPPGKCVDFAYAGLPQMRIRVNGKLFHDYSGLIWRWEHLSRRDLTPYLVKGENTLEVELLRDSTENVPDDVWAFIGKLTFPDGRTLLTDDSWDGARDLGGVRDTDFGKRLVLRDETLSPAFQKSFCVPRPVRRATLFVTGVGFYEATLNGHRIGDKVLDPSPTDYNRRVLYSTYLLDDAVRPGTNVLNVLVGHGWYDVRSIATWDYSTAPWRDFPRMIAQLELEYVDGGRETVVSDGSWKQAGSPVLYDCIREGEVLRGGMVQTVDLPVAEVPAPKGRLAASGLPGAQIMETLKPIRIKDFGSGTYVLKFAKDIAGWIRLDLRSQRPGDVVTVRYDERVNEDLSPAAGSSRNGLDACNPVDISKASYGKETRRIDCHYRYPASHRICPANAAFQTDRYICSGGEETYEPHFTYNGFRYVVLRGLREEPSPEDVAGVCIRTSFEETGSVITSDENLNALMGMASQAYRSNFADGVPTDCPHREKNGWTGDASIASELAQYLVENTAAYEKWLNDVADAQNERGDIPGIIPTSGWGFRWGNGPAWDSALWTVAWNLYRYRADRHALEIAYPVLKRLLAYTATKENSRGLVEHGIGDWNAVDARHVPSMEYTSSCYYLQACETAAKMARVFGLNDDVVLYEGKAERIRETVVRVFGKSDGTFDNGLQTAQAFAIVFGLVSGEARVRTAAKLVESVEKADGHCDYGLLGSKWVFRALSNIGRTDLAYRMLVNPSSPSMLDWRKKGATSLWEDWGDGASRNHVMYGDFAGWVYRCLAGIDLEDGTAFRKSLIAPCPVPGLDRLQASVETPYGILACSWWRKGDEVFYEVVVPPGTSAELQLPGLPKRCVEVGTHNFHSAW